MALAICVGTASFALVAVAVAGIDADALVALVGLASLGAVVAMERAWGVAYAVPAAMASLLAFDWYQFPPTHPHELPDAANLADLAVYIGVAVLVGQLAANAARRADASEAARSIVAAEQAALRRVATLVARGIPPADVFAAVAREAGELLGVDATHLGRYEPGGATGVGSWSRSGDQLPVGTRATVEGGNVTALVLKTGRPARVDTYPADADSPIDQLLRDVGIRSSVGAPIVVDGQLWGVMIASSKQDEALPADTESRIAAFTELVATAISNAEARAEMQRLADEQAALRRVATLVAREPSPEEVFAKIAEEVGMLLDADAAAVSCYGPDGAATVVGSWGGLGDTLPVGHRWKLDGRSVTALVYRTGRPARLDDYEDATDADAAYLARNVGLHSAVGTPISVGGRLWGSIAAGSRAQPMPADAESRIAEFADLAATAIANVQARSDLAASRARIVATADHERRRVVRDLHDGAQQRLVHALITLKLARQALQDETESASDLVDEALAHTENATAELRELAHGILPSVLVRGGLRAGVEALAARMPVPVETDVAVDRLPEPVEATAYFVVAEALTNVAKHAHAERAAVSASVEDGALRVRVRDDGVGGARADGTGLVGLADRLAVLQGGLRVESPADGGTLVAAAIPLS